MTFHPSRFEEERLRYVFSKESKLAAYFRVCLRKNIKEGVKEDAFDLSCCRNIAALRSAEQLSSDIVFLCALTKLHESYKIAVRSVCSEETVIARLEDTDANIYSYVIEKIEEIRSVLKTKADEAAAIRDWKPAAKFAEPEALAAMFFERIEKKWAGNVLTLKFPKFFGTTDLKLSIHKVGNIYYVHDNGFSIKHLLKQVVNKEKCDRVLKKVCASCWIEKRKITGSFCSATDFLYYLQRLVFVAHADLYYTKAERPLYYKEKGYSYIPADEADPLDETALLDVLKTGISFSYDENIGLYYWLDTRYSLFSVRASYLLETLENGYIRISDRQKGNIEGEILEAFYWSNDDISPYSKFLSNFTARFGAEFIGKDIYLTDNPANFVKAAFKFFNLAVLLSEFGHDIALPRIRQKVQND